MDIDSGVVVVVVQDLYMEDHVTLFYLDVFSVVFMVTDDRVVVESHLVP